MKTDKDRISDLLRAVLRVIADNPCIRAGAIERHELVAAELLSLPGNRRGGRSDMRLVDATLQALKRAGLISYRPGWLKTRKDGWHATKKGVESL